VFGEKDYQQLCVVRQMVRDLNMPIDIIGVPTTREADGLALSSRNAYLTAEERKVAPALNRVLHDVAEKANAVMRGTGTAKNKAPRPTPLVRDPTLPPQAHELPDLAAICDAAVAELLGAGFAKVDYVAVRHADTLKSVTETGDAPLRVLAAAWLGGTRLIDNVAA
jgi:pantoate--beta-alanine ligase